MRHLSLFTGIGGGEYGAKLLGWETVGYVEHDEYCCRVIEQRIKDGIFDDAPVFQGDVRDFIADGYAEAYSGMVDIVTGGPPCQGFSVAGKGLGKEDSRNMVPAMLDVVEIVRPAFVFIENAPSKAFRCYMLEYILPRLAEMGYDSAWGVVSAEDAIWLNCYPGVPAVFHERKRTWILAVAATHLEGIGCDKGIHCSEQGRQAGEGLKPMLQVSDTDGTRELQQERANCDKRRWIGDSDKEVPDSDMPGRQEQREQVTDEAEQSAFECCGWWSTEPRLDRLVHGATDRVKRIKADGNAQVPAVFALAWWMLTC